MRSVLRAIVVGDEDHAQRLARKRSTDGHRAHLAAGALVAYTGVYGADDLF